MNDRREERKIRIIIAAALVCVCVAAVFGIGAIIRNNNTDEEVLLTEDNTENADVIVEDIEAEEIIIASGLETDLEGEAECKTEQELQPEATVPEAPENPTPIGDATDPSTPPTYDLPEVETKQESAPKLTTPTDADSHPGEIYVQGFGWLPYTGPSHSEYASDCYTNGHQVGEM